MAINIGTQLVGKLEEISKLHGVMQGISIIGTSINNYEAYESLFNVFAYVQDLHNDLFDEFDTMLKERVLPIVSHINTGA